MGLRLRIRSLMTLFFIGVFSYVVYESWYMELQAKLFPWTIGLIALALLAWQLVVEIKPAKATESDATGMDLDFSEEESSSAGKWRAFELFLWIYGFAALLWLVGFFIAIPLTVFLYLLRQREKPLVTILLPLSAGLATWGLFDNLIHVPFPPGQIFEWLGWV